MKDIASKEGLSIGLLGGGIVFLAKDTAHPNQPFFWVGAFMVIVSQWLLWSEIGKRH